jgi:hypothetical protein
LRPFADDFPVREILCFLAGNEDGVEQLELYDYCVHRKLTKLRDGVFFRNLTRLAHYGLLKKIAPPFDAVTFQPVIRDIKEISDAKIKQAIEAHMNQLERECGYVRVDKKR